MKPHLFKKSRTLAFSFLLSITFFSCMSSDHDFVNYEIPGEGTCLYEEFQVANIAESEHFLCQKVNDDFHIYVIRRYSESLYTFEADFAFTKDEIIELSEKIETMEQSSKTVSDIHIDQNRYYARIQKVNYKDYFDKSKTRYLFCVFDKSVDITESSTNSFEGYVRAGATTANNYSNSVSVTNTVKSKKVILKEETLITKEFFEIVKKTNDFLRG